jgi:Tfp pilus assembly protein PilF
MRSTLVAAAAVLSLGFSTMAFAAGGGGSDSQPIQSTKPVDPNFTRAKAMIETNKDYANALPLLQQVVAKDPRNADAYNLMGYATRKSGNANGSLQYYQQALAIDPRHLGAYEYLDRPAEADQMLARLDSLCVFGCTEYRMLKAAVASYKQGKKPTN